MHEEKEELPEKIQCLSLQCPCYSTLVPPPSTSLTAPKHFLARSETHIVNVDVELAALPILLLAWASVTVAKPYLTGNHNDIWTLTSQEFESTVSLTCASADEMFLFMRSLTGVAIL